MSRELTYWVALHSVPGLGAATFLKLLEKFNHDPKTIVLDASEDELKTIPRIKKDIIQNILIAKENIETARDLLENLTERGIEVLTMYDSDYPDSLRTISNPPPVIYLYGKFSSADQNAIAIVGSREASEHGLNVARSFGNRFAQRGITIVSGYAKGIDTAGHLGALEAGGRTVLVIPSGILHFRMRRIFSSVDFSDNQGVIISESPPTEQWNVGAAMARNRLVVGLSRAVLIVEAQEHGGTMNTFSVARKEHRPVFVVDYQDSQAFARGNQMLIQQGAIPLSPNTDVEEMLRRISPNDYSGIP